MLDAATTTTIIIDSVSLIETIDYWGWWICACIIIHAILS